MFEKQIEQEAFVKHRKRIVVAAGTVGLFFAHAPEALHSAAPGPPRYVRAISSHLTVPPGRTRPLYSVHGRAPIPRSASSLPPAHALALLERTTGPMGSLLGRNTSVSAGAVFPVAFGR